MDDPALARERAIAQSREEVARRPVYLDTETTGLGDDAEIVELCLIDAAGQVLVDTLVLPERRIPPDATRIHGITDAMVRGAPRWQEVWPKVRPLLGGRRVGVYNAGYDVPLIQAHNRRYQLDPPASATAFCIMKLYARYQG